MKRLTTLAALATLSLHATASTIVDFSFDDTANDIGPAFQEFDNATGSPVYSITTGAINTSGTAAAGFVELAVDAGGYSFTQLISAPTVSANDGFSLDLTFTDNGAGDADVAVISTGMGTDINYSGTIAGFTYASFADTVSGNVSSQGNADFDMASYRIVAIPEPATLGLFSLIGGAGIFVRRRFMR